MKQKLALLVALAVSAASVLAQGTVNFQNGGPGVNAPIRDASATPALLAGNAFGADLYWGLGTVTDAGLLQSAGLSTPFGTGASAGYFFGNVQALAGVPAGTLITVQVRAWRTADGASWLAASTPAGAWHGEGNLFQVTTGGGTIPPPFFTAMTSFNLTANPVPEPSTFVLAGLGLASLLLFRRRK
jgi:hypothetical protein